MLRVDSLLSLSNAAAAAANSGASASSGSGVLNSATAFATQTQSELASDVLKRNDIELGNEPNELEEQRFQRTVEDKLIDRLKSAGSKAFHMSDIVSFVSQGIQTVANDDFSKCFQSHPRDAWNFNFYLYPLWLLGVVFRYAILFPVRLVLLLTGLLLLIPILLLLPAVLPDKGTRARYQRMILRWLCGLFVMSWTGVIKYHGVIPARRPNQVRGVLLMQATVACRDHE